jgi:hypothetical protein
MFVKSRLDIIARSLVITGTLMAGIAGSAPANAHSDWAAPFMGGLLAGHIATNFARVQQERTQALQSMAYGGEGGFGRPTPYGYGRPVPAAPAAPSAPSPEQQLNTLDQLAARGYITPQEYQARRQAILNSM